MGWNHRIIAHESSEEIYYQIHEVYYWKGTPISYTKKGINVGGENIEELSWTLNRVKECLGKPVLSARNFPSEHKPK